MDQQIYARIEAGHVVQFPMTIDDINIRDNPADTYYPCFYKPLADGTQPKLSEKIVEAPWILGEVVYVEQTKTNRSVEELFQYLAQVAVNFTEEGQPFIDRALITPEIFSAFEEVVKIRVQSMLDDFAKTRGYDDMKSVCTYNTSSNPVYLQEALRAIYLRDFTWSTLYSYFGAVMFGQADVPTSWEDIASNLPELTWEA